MLCPDLIFEKQIRLEKSVKMKKNTPYYLRSDAPDVVGVIVEEVQSTVVLHER